MKILIAPDKFKGSLEAIEVAKAIARGLHEVLSGAILQLNPIADGGEGFARALSPKWTNQLTVLDALLRPVTAEYGWLDESHAVIEMSAASGLWRIASKERAPLLSSSRGTGELIADAISRGATTILVGLGGSATNDGGAGMAAALGYQFLDCTGIPVEPLPANLLRVAKIVPPVKRQFPRILAACDVDNPLLGFLGATRVYGPQKGALPGDLEHLEEALAHLVNLVSCDLGHDFQSIPGAGAAGGLGFGLLSFCNAEIRSGFELVAEVTELDKAIASSDLVITGEGKLDRQTLRGKGPAGVAALAHKFGVPVIAIAGCVEPCAEMDDLFEAVYALKQPGMQIEECVRNASALLETTATSVGLEILKSRTGLKS